MKKHKRHEPAETAPASTPPAETAAASTSPSAPAGDASSTAAASEPSSQATSDTKPAASEPSSAATPEPKPAPTLPRTVGRYTLYAQKWQTLPHKLTDRELADRGHMLAHFLAERDDLDSQIKAAKEGQRAIDTKTERLRQELEYRHTSAPVQVYLAQVAGAGPNRVAILRSDVADLEAPEALVELRAMRPDDAQPELLPAPSAPSAAPVAGEGVGATEKPYTWTRAAADGATELRFTRECVERDALSARVGGRAPVATSFRLAEIVTLRQAEKDAHLKAMWQAGMEAYTTPAAETETQGAADAQAEGTAPTDSGATLASPGDPLPLVPEQAGAATATGMDEPT